MNRIQKKVLFYSIAVILAIGVIELFSYIFFSFYTERFTFHSVQQYLLRDEDLRGLSERYDRQLGWDNRYDTQYGERPRTVSYDETLLSTFGDSFMFCADVEDDETWQTYLSDMLQANVYNFGISGYGTDQAYMKYLSIQPELNAPIVVLGIIAENINRIVNVYRPFYFSKTGIRLPKPRFKLADDRLILIENPIENIDGIEMLREEKFIRKLGENDWWYNRDNYPIYQFPYLKILFNKRMWLEVFYGKSKHRIDDLDPRPWENLWKNPLVTDLMLKIIESFITDVRDNKSTPIIMILPMQDQVFEKFCTGKDPKSVSIITDYCRRNKCLCFNAIDPLVNSVDTMEEIPQLFVVHVSAKGNRIIADQFFKFIRRNIRL